MFRIWVAIIVLTVLSSCTSLAEFSGTVLEGGYEKTLSKEKKTGGIVIKKVRRRDKSETFVLTLKKWKGLKIYFWQDGQGNIGYASYHFIASSYDGWNEFVAELSAGSGGAPVRGEIVGGRIRRGDVRIVGSSALAALAARSGRIDYLAGWMKAQDGVPAFSVENPKKGEKAFAKYWKPLLFPKNADAAVPLPPELEEVRESGALLRDWEEALPWLYLAYQWDEIVRFFAI